MWWKFWLAISVNAIHHSEQSTKNEAKRYEGTVTVTPLSILACSYLVEELIEINLLHCRYEKRLRLSCVFCFGEKRPQTKYWILTRVPRFAQGKANFRFSWRHFNPLIGVNRTYCSAVPVLSTVAVPIPTLLLLPRANVWHRWGKALVEAFHLQRKVPVAEMGQMERNINRDKWATHGMRCAGGAVGFSSRFLSWDLLSN